MEKYKVVVSRDLGPDAMPYLFARPELEVIVWPEGGLCERKWLLENVQGASGIIVTLAEKVDEELIDKAGPSLKVVSTMSVGYEHVSLPILAKRGIRLGYTPDILTDAVADVAILLALMASRNVKQTTTIVQNGDWPNYTWSPFLFCGPQISGDPLPSIISPSESTTDIDTGRVAGFLGFGRIAKATLKRLVAFGVKRCIYTGNPSSSSKNSSSEEDDKLASQLGLSPGSITRVSLQDLASRSDILFVLAPGGQSTYHIINASIFSLMKPTSILINASRGTLVDSYALADALREKKIWGAGVDVVEGEPGEVRKDHPLVKEERCVVLPHVGSATFETRKGMALLTVRNVVGGVLGGKMPTELELKEYI
ncbi:glyoxylate reductase [Pyrrhoderma noxium]|uniref:Glyoxylate reductase n=1 Tax=Pyrrhoderma noxium TaxID=2282107 RepID=A0A286UHL2_9AGAM|nr:glyoxylate reductase [Pyrrhoderma noxium]